MRKTDLMLLLCLFSSFFMISGSAEAGEELLDNAYSEERSLSEFSAMMESIKLKQEDSRLFSGEEIKETEASIDTVSLVKTEHIQTVITALEEKNDSNQDETYTKAGEEYSVALEKIDKIIKKYKGRYEQQKNNAALLSALKEMTQELKDLSSQMTENNLNEENLNKLAEVTAEQQELKNLTDDALVKEKLEKITNELEKQDLQSAVQSLESLMEQMEKTALEQMETPLSEQELQAAQTEMLDQTLEELSAMEKQLETELSTEARQEMAEKLSETAEALKTPEAAAAQQQLNEALSNLMDQQDKKTQENIAAAKMQLQQMKNAVGSQPPPPSPVVAGKNNSKAQKNQQKPPPLEKKISKRQDSSEESGDSKQVDAQEDDGKGLEIIRIAMQSESSWEASLPENERAAFSNTRKAKYNESFGEEVSRYFMKLANENP